MTLRTWWIWRGKPEWKGGVGMRHYRDVELELPYLAKDANLDPYSSATLSDDWQWEDTEPYSDAQRIMMAMPEMYDRSEGRNPYRISAIMNWIMVEGTTLHQSSYGHSYQIAHHVVITPPIFRFATIVGSQHDERRIHRDRKVGLWFQPDVWNVGGRSTPVGVFFVGEPEVSGLAFKPAVLVPQKSPPGVPGLAEIYNDDVAAQASVALDSYLETGKPDPRFL